MIALVGLAFLDLLLHLSELRVELPNDVLLLLFLELIHTHRDVIYFPNDLFLHLLVDVGVLQVSVLFKAKANSQLVLKLINGLAIFKLTLAVTLLATTQVLLDLLVFIHLGI